MGSSRFPISYSGSCSLGMHQENGVRFDGLAYVTREDGLIRVARRGVRELKRVECDAMGVYVSPAEIS